MRALLLLAAMAVPLAAHEPITTKLTWTREISRLIDRHCMACHGDGASVPLAGYESARPWAKAIRDQVMTRQMPPWGAVPGFGPELQSDPSLTVSEIDMLVRWVEGGAPKGDGVATTAPLVSAKSMPLPPPYIRLSCDWKTPRELRLAGIIAEHLASTDQLRVTAELPDGGTLPVIWIRNLPEHSAGFRFTRAFTVPANATLHLDAPQAAHVLLAVSAPAASPPQPEKAIPTQTPRCPSPPRLPTPHEE